MLKETAHHTLLKGVSRSFYLSLRLLPRPMRGAAGLAYLLARTSDTLADSASAPPEMRLECLDHFHQALAGGQVVPEWPGPLVEGVPDPREKQLLAVSRDVLENLNQLPDAEARLVRDVIATIISGQQLDLGRFGRAGPDRPVVLADDAELDDYTWRVAGCVGAFWTRLGFLTLGEAFSKQSAGRLTELGIAYGKGLQLVNILRDLPDDLAHGRCYLPLPDPSDRPRLMEEYSRWLKQAREQVAQGFAYAPAIRSRRARAATILPAMIARDTLELLEHAGPGIFQHRIKVARGRVYQSLVRALLWNTAG